VERAAPVSEQPTATASPGGGGKILGVPRRTFLIIIGSGLVVGIGFLLWRKYQSGAAAGASTASTAGASQPVDQSGELSVIQSELEALLQQDGLQPAGTTTGSGGGSGGGQSWGNGGGWSGGGSGDGGSSGGGGGSAGSGTASDGGAGMAGSGTATTTTGGASGTTTPTTSSGKPAAPTGGKATTTATGATVTWNPNGAAKWSVKITGPGKINGFTNTVTVPKAVYSGLESGHDYTVTVTPLSASGTPGPSGNVNVETK
jgi:hypothetical protein